MPSVKHLRWESLSPTSYQVSLKRYSKFIAFFVLMVGVAVLFGWLFDLEMIKRPMPKLVAMNPTTALCFVLISVSFVLITNSDFPLGKVGGGWLAIIAVIISGLILCGYLFDFSIHFDEIFLSKRLAMDQAAGISIRMAPNTALNFLMASGILLVERSKAEAKFLTQWFAFAIGLVSLFSILGYLYNVEEFMGILKYVPMAIHTAISFFLFSVALLFYSSDRGLMKEITSYYAGGVVGRILMPLAIFIPAVLGYLQLTASESFIFTTEFGTAVLIISFIVIFILILWFLIFSLNKQEGLQKEAEEKTRIAYTLLQSSLESHKDVLIFSVDKQYRYLNFNSAFSQATKMAYGTTVIEGSSMLDSITSDKDKLKAKFNCDQALAGVSHSSIEIYGTVTKSFFETWYNPILDGAGEIIGVTVLASNVTERKEKEDQIKELNKDLEAFSYTVAHDLRAPVRIIGGYSEMVLEDYGKKLDEEGRKLIRTIATNSTRMGQLIEGLLNFSKLGRSPVDKKPVKVAAMINTIIAEQIRNIEKDKIQFKLGKLEDLICDENLFYHVFTNLISNAIKYSNKKNRILIEIDSKAEENEVTYYIKDNGVGFEMKYADKIFGVFNRLHTPADFEGTGVGLAIVHKIISKHNGKIWVDAEPNRGATFCFSLPS